MRTGADARPTGEEIEGGEAWMNEWTAIHAIALWYEEIGCVRLGTGGSHGERHLPQIEPHSIAVINIVD
jgi:hypothetical protein